MKEAIKSLVLVILVLGSLLQTYLLIYGSSTFEPNRNTEYVRAGLGGSQEKAGNLLFPEQMVIHLGEREHTVLYPKNLFYDMILETLRQRKFDGFRTVSGELPDWQEIRDQYPGLEIRFGSHMPLSILRQIFQINSALFKPHETIEGIWIYADTENEEVKVFFITESSTTVYEDTMSDFTVEDIEKFVSLGQYLPRYRVVEKRFYVPEEPMETYRYEMTYETFTIEELQKTLFLDPDITRNLTERDGSQIYTDGRRGLRIDKDGLWMSFTDPVAPTETENNAEENLLSAVTFVNQHGGWNGNYLAHFQPQTSIYEGQTIRFRQYYDSYPIIDVGKNRFGLIEITVQKGIVSAYERSIINLQGEMKKEKTVLPGGKMLEPYLRSMKEKYRVEKLFPAYVPQIDKDKVILSPQWVIQMNDGEYQIVRVME